MRNVGEPCDPGCMDTSTARHTSSGQRGRLVTFLLGTCIVLTAVTGVVVGWFAVHLQLFGEVADADDYAVASGAYGAGAAVLLFGGVAAWSRRSPPSMVAFAVVAAGALTVLAVSAAASGASAEPGSGYNHWWDGAGGVVACPWTWPLVVLGAFGVFRGRGRDDVSG